MGLFDNNAPAEMSEVSAIEQLLEEAPHPEAAKTVVKVGGAFRNRADTPPGAKAVLRAEGRTQGFEPHQKTIGKARRAVIAKALTSGEDPLEIMLDNARWAFRRALKAQKNLEGGVEEAAVLREVIGFRELAQTCAVAAAPYLHSKLAPKIPKGESGLTVNLVIEDA